MRGGALALLERGSEEWGREGSAEEPNLPGCLEREIPWLFSFIRGVMRLLGNWEEEEEEEEGGGRREKSMVCDGL